MQFYINEFVVNKDSNFTHSYIIENDWILYGGDSSAYYKNIYNGTRYYYYKVRS